jgi:serine phosphatase RsbU (regulator of sigma subunit)
LPLASGGRARALIVLSWGEPVPPPSAEVSAVASRFADQAGVALAEAARREAQREAGELHARFEESLLPSISLAGTGVSAATFYRPGDERLSLGGDFYDCLELSDGTLAMLIGDVAGHGPSAAALGAGLRSAWRALVLGGWPLGDLFDGMQAVCSRERDDPYQFVTAITATVDPHRRRLRCVSAGHPPPLVAGAGPVPIPEHGPPLGVVAEPAWQVVELDLPAKATVVLYTDGLIEGRAAPGATERLGIEPIERLLAQAEPGAVGPDELRRLVDFAAEAHGAGLPDDVALLALNLFR